MKIIHCADLHLDSKMTANLTKEKAKLRKNELLNTFKNMIAYAEENNVEAIIIAGDLYDTKNISVTAKNTVINEIRQHTEIDFYYLRGNHDSDSLLSEIDIPTNLKLFNDSWTSYVANDTKKTDKNNNSTYMTEKVINSESEDNQEAIDSAEVTDKTDGAICDNKTDKVAGNSKTGAGNIIITGVELTEQNNGAIYNTLALDNDKFNIVVLHGQESMHRVKNDAWNISIRELKNRGIDYLALGHIHEYREGRIDKRGIYCYPGCLEGRGFDECGEHGFVLLDIDEQSKNFTSELIPIACRNLYTIEVDISDCMSTADISDRIGNCLDGASCDEKNLIKIVLTGYTDINCEKNIDLLVKEFEDNYFFLKIYDESKFKVDYESYRLDESLKGEFVRTVMKEEKLTDEDKAEIIRYGIQFLMGNFEERIL